MKRLRDLGEEEVVARLLAVLPESPRALVGPGDDCAVVRRGKGLELLKTDAVVEGVHFLPEENPARVGWKAAARVISDFAAMGGGARELMVTLAVGGDTPLEWLEGLYCGLGKCARTFGAEVVGGETTSVPPGSARVISVAGTGAVAENEVVLRSGGQSGDRLFVTGKLGGSLAGKHLDFTPRAEEGRWLARHFRPHAMMDLSDGLARDLPRMARASGCGFEIRENDLPRNEGCQLAQALGDGEDYELLFAFPADAEKELRAAWEMRFPDLALTAIGRLSEKNDESLPGGWQHFA